MKSDNKALSTETGTENPKWKRLQPQQEAGIRHESLELTPVWVLAPGYRISPSEVGDTLSMPADSRLRYERFMTDTRLLLVL